MRDSPPDEWTSGGAVTWRKPLIYIAVGRLRAPCLCRFMVKEKCRRNAHRMGQVLVSQSFKFVSLSVCLFVCLILCSTSLVPRPRTRPSPGALGVRLTGGSSRYSRVQGAAPPTHGSTSGGGVSRGLQGSGTRCYREGRRGTRSCVPTTGQRYWGGVPQVCVVPKGGSLCLRGKSGPRLQTPGAGPRPQSEGATKGPHSLSPHIQETLLHGDKISIQASLFGVCGAVSRMLVSPPV